MNPEIKGKAAVAIVISLIAFGFGTGASMLTDFSFYSPNNSSFSIKQPGDLPIVYNVKNTSNVNTTTSNPSTEQSSSNSQDVYEEPTTTTPTYPGTSNQSGNQSTTP
jgi:hypothetical protein